MPTGNLPESGKKLWEQVYQQSKKKGDCDEGCAAAKAWKAVENAGWKKNKEGKWTRNKSAVLSEFSFTIKKASLDPETGERRWRADTSDTEIDSYGDKMSLELYENFLSKIEKGELPPEEYRSEFWKGGLPYLSISHYPDANGAAVPGEVKSLYVDGKFLKAKGTFNETPLGIKCWEAIKNDLQTDPEKEDRVRISIAFLDYKHRHLSEVSKGFVFERKSLEDICPMCIAEMFTGDGGKEFLEGHLIHLALTRVPVNKRTLMEVDRSMTTQIEDAASIVGEDLAEEVAEKVKELSQRSMTLTMKSENGEQTFEIEIPELTELRAKLDEVLELLMEGKDKKKKDEEDEDEMDSKKKKDEEKSELAGTEETVEEQIVGVDPVLALAESIQTGMLALSEGLGQKLDILISANAQKPNVQVPQPLGLKSTGVQELPPVQAPKPGKPLTPAEYVKLQFQRGV